MRDRGQFAASSKPITGIAGCCVRAKRGHAVAPAITDMNSRRLIAAPLTTR